MQMASSSLLPLFVLVLVLLFSISSADSSKSSFLDGINQNPIKMIKVANGVSQDLLKLDGMEVKNNQQSGSGSYVIVGPWGRKGLFDTSFDHGAHGGITEIGLNYTDGGIVGGNVTYADGSFFNISRPSNESVRITLDLPNEQIAEMEWTADHLGPIKGGRITSLTFKTNTNKTFGPYGSTGTVIMGRRLNLPIESGSIVGFKGSFGRFLSSLGIYLSPSDYK